MYKNLLRYAAITLLVVACFDRSVLAPDTQVVDGIDLGRASLSMSILNMPREAQAGRVQVELAVTPGAKYALQLLNLKGQVVSSFGFTAVDPLEVVELDYGAVAPGSYDLAISDVSGKTKKRPLVILGR